LKAIAAIAPIAMPNDGCKQRSVIRAAAGAAAVAILYAPPASAPPRASAASCREAVNGLISLLDAGQDGSALYRETYAVVVNGCGPARRGSEPPPPNPPPSQSRAACHGLAGAMVDLIEDDKMDSDAFAQARQNFAAACTPR
jgi:hypothetical protein